MRYIYKKSCEYRITPEEIENIEIQIEITGIREDGTLIIDENDNLFMDDENDIDMKREMFIADEKKKITDEEIKNWLLFNLWNSAEKESSKNDNEKSTNDLLKVMSSALETINKNQMIIYSSVEEQLKEKDEQINNLRKKNEELVKKVNEFEYKEYLKESLVDFNKEQLEKLEKVIDHKIEKYVQLNKSGETSFARRIDVDDEDLKNEYVSLINKADQENKSYKGITKQLASKYNVTSATIINRLTNLGVYKGVYNKEKE